MTPEAPPSNNQKLNASVALLYLNDIKDLFQDKTEKYEEFLEILKDLKSQRIDTNGVMMRVKELFNGHRELTLGFNIFLPHGYEINLPEEKKPVEYDEAFSFVNKIKTRFQNEEHIYKEFLDILNMYRSYNKSIQDVYQEVAVLFQSHLDLLEEFKHFLPNTSAPTDLQHPFSIKPALSHDDMENDRERGEIREQFDKGSHSVLKDRVGERELDDMEKDSERGEVREQFDKGSHSVLKDASNHKVPLVSKKEMFSLYKPVSELDLSNCQRCTPSYRLLPRDYLMPTTSQRTGLDASPLNDACVSRIEDCSFKHRSKDQYEESLLRCEDDRFELDVLIGSANTAIKKVEKLLKKIEKGKIKPESPFLLEDHFKTINLKFIERLYGDHGPDVIDVLQKNASHALPIILTRLKQKHEDWSKCRADFNKVWGKVYFENYHNSRSFYFKQQDTKNLSAKALLSEVKEIIEKKRKEDDVLLAFAAGNQWPIIPSFEFEYPDPDIFNDIYQLVKYSSHELCTSSDQFNKVMRIWTTFLEPIFGVPSRPQETYDSGNVSEGRENISGSESGNKCFHEDHEEKDVNQDAMAEIEGEAERIADANDAEVEITPWPISEHFLHTVKPISEHLPSSMQEKGDSCSTIFYGSDSFYVLFKLHQTLYERMLSAKISSSTTDLYIKFKAALHSLLDGTSDNTKFEDDCRAILGTESYFLFTLDKWIYKIVEQLQAIVSDEMENKLCQLYFYEKSRQPGRFFDAVYHENARFLLHDESVYRFECSSNSTKLSIQLMEYGLEKPEATAVSTEPNFSSYMFNDYLSSTSESNGRIGIFMKRNKRKFEGDDALDGLQIFNGLECKIASHSSKVSYVMDTEDVLFRPAKRRRSSSRAPTASQN